MPKYNTNISTGDITNTNGQILIGNFVYQDKSRNTPEYFTKWVNRLYGQASGLLGKARKRALPANQIRKDLDTYSAFYEELLRVAKNDNISIEFYGQKFHAIRNCLDKIDKILEKQERRQSGKLPDFFMSLLSIASELDGILQKKGFSPLASPIAMSLLKVLGYLLLQLGSGKSTRAQRLLPSPKSTVVTKTTPKKPALKPEGKIELVWVDHNIQENQQKGMKIHVKFNARNLNGIDCRAAAYFSFSSGQKLIDNNNSYFASDGQVAVGRDFKPTYDFSDFLDLTIFMPYSELHLANGKHNLRFQVDLYEKVTNIHFASSEYYHFTLTK